MCCGQNGRPSKWVRRAMNLTANTMTNVPILYGLAINKKMWHRLRQTDIKRPLWIRPLWIIQYRPGVEALWSTLSHTPWEIQKCTRKKKEKNLFIGKSSCFSFPLANCSIVSIHLSSIYHPFPVAQNKFLPCNSNALLAAKGGHLFCSTK